ncbi:M56 family metallopeptidase [Acetivibrio straminisolvens]|nr:M56 family metallopeptidase [Acetivibrio straminisolvens]
MPLLFRLVCPFSFESALSLFNLINLNAKPKSGVSPYVPQNMGQIPVPYVQAGVGGADSAVNASVSVAASAASINPMDIWITVFSLVWISGVIALLVYSIFSYAKTKRKLETATLVEGNVFETDAIGTAFVCGFIRPRIYVPTDIRGADLSYILEHERTHIRRKDYLIKLIAFLALILHWFNPLMWLCFALMNRDMEMSCDESVLRRLGEGAKGGYSNSLLSMSVKGKEGLAVAPLAFGESNVKTRIKNVLNFKKPKFWVVIVAVAAVLTASIVFATNASKEGKISAKDRKKLTEVVSEYYKKSDPANNGSLIIYNIKDCDSGYLVLTEKYSGEGENFSLLFLIDFDFNIVAKASGNMPISPCFSANLVEHQGKSIVYGNFDKKKWEWESDTVVDVEIDRIKIFFDDGSIIEEAVSMDKGYIVVADTTAGIKNIELYNKKGELQSNLNDTILNQQDLIKVGSDTVFYKDDEYDANTQFDKSKVESYQLATVVIQDCLAKAGPGENYKSMGALEYGVIVRITGKYENWVLCSADRIPGEFWIEKSNLIDEIIMANSVKVGSAVEDKGNLVRILIIDEDRTCVVALGTDTDVPEVGWIKNRDYILAKDIKEGFYFRQAFLKKGTVIYDNPSSQANAFRTTDTELFVNIEKEINGWVLILGDYTYDRVVGWVKKEDIFIPTPYEMTDDEQKAFQVVQEYFAAFEIADYDAMRILSTENHNNNFIHDGDVWGMKWARAKKIELVEDARFLRIENSDSVLAFIVSVDMETVETSAQYPSTQTTFYVVVVKGDDGKWSVDKYETG